MDLHSMDNRQGHRSCVAMCADSCGGLQTCLWPREWMKEFTREKWTQKTFSSRSANKNTRSEQQTSTRRYTVSRQIYRLSATDLLVWILHFALETETISCQLFWKNRAVNFRLCVQHVHLYRGASEYFLVDLSSDFWSSVIPWDLEINQSDSSHEWDNEAWWSNWKSKVGQFVLLEKKKKNTNKQMSEGSRVQSELWDRRSSRPWKAVNAF